MPTSDENHTPARSVRIPTPLWNESKAAAADSGTTVSAVINELLSTYVRKRRSKKGN